MVLTAVLVVLPHVQAAVALIAYPWDWSPDEGLYLDHGRRFARAPASLYAAGVVPVPAGYGPVMPALLAPIAGLARPLGAARVLACGWTLLIVAAAYVLVRRRAPAHLAAASAALALAPAHLSFWYLLVRPDGPMVALWLWAAVPLLPARLERGADALGWPRATIGALLLAAAAFTKPTAVVHGAPLVLGWLLVDRRSALRLSALVLALGAAVFAVLEAGTEGGYLRVLRLWGSHDPQPGLFEANLRFFLLVSAPLLVFLLLGMARAARRGSRPLRDPALLLVAGGLALLPTLGKYGALAHYLLPLLCALAVLAGRAWAPADWPAPSGRPPEPLPAAACVVVLLVFLATQAPPLPPRGAEATARAFYGAVVDLVRDEGRPLLALRPEYAYFLVDQPVEAEGSGFKFLLAAGAPGAGDVLSGLETRRYRTVVVLAEGVTRDEPLARAMLSQYVSLGECDLSFYYGRSRAVLLVPRDRSARFDPPPGTRCRVAAPPAE